MIHYDFRAGFLPEGGAVLPGTRVATAYDLGGGGLHLSQPVVANRPVIGAMASGAQALVSTAAEEWLFSDHPALAGMVNDGPAVDRVISTLIEFDTVTTTQTIVGWTRASTNTDECWIGSTTKGGLRVFREVGGVYGGADSAPVFTEPGKPYLVSVAIRGGLVDAWVNGIMVLDGKPFCATTPVLAADRFVLCARDQSTDTQGFEGRLQFVRIEEGDGLEIHAALLQAFLPEEIVDTWVMAGIGQSMVGGASPIPNAVPFETSSGVAWAIDRRAAPNYGNLVGPFRNGAYHSVFFGQSAGWPHFAERLHDLTGIHTLWSNFAEAGTQLVPATNPGAVHWSPVDLGNCLAGDMLIAGEPFTRRDLIADTFAAADRHPKFRVSKRVVYMRHGHSDALGGIYTGRITAADYEAHLNALFDFMAAEFGVDLFLLDELGRKGNDLTTVAANEPWFAPIREAQNAVAASRDDTLMVFTGAKEFGPLVVDAQGRHVSGWDLQADAVHDTEFSQRCMGLTWAENVVQALGLT